VDIFALQDERKSSTFDLSLDFRQSSHNLLALTVGEQTHATEHPRVRDRTPYIMLEQPMVKRDGLREPLDSAVRPGLESSTPGLGSHARISRENAAGA
jgi:hypothetical protein